jgi:hypothetical protein
VIGSPAKIIKKELYLFKPAPSYLYPTQADAEADGFESVEEMIKFFHKSYGDRIFREPMNKLTLERLPW